MRPRFDATSLIWGLLFGTVLVCGLWQLTGHSLSWSFIRLGIPVLLIVLGALGLILSRISTRPTKRD